MLQDTAQYHHVRLELQSHVVDKQDQLGNDM
jgi:hypothetical protein